MRVGIIGYGRWAPNLARNLAKHATIAFVCDPSTEAQQRARDAGYVSCGAPMWDRCDAVAIASPIMWHHAQAVDALINEGKHVLCEKPLCTSPDDVEYLAEDAAGTGL